MATDGRLPTKKQLHVGFALLAVTEYLELVAFYLKIVLIRKALLYCCYGFFIKFYDFSTIHAPQVAVVVMAVDVFIVEMAVFEIGFLNQTGFQQQGNDAVDGRFGDLFVFFFKRRYSSSTSK